MFWALALGVLAGARPDDHPGLLLVQGVEPDGFLFPKHGRAGPQNMGLSGYYLVCIHK